ncbi:unnamed protein product, partial [Rotaria sordida]
FNSDSDKCLCIISLKASKIFDQTHYIKVLLNSLCDRYCKNTFEGSSSDIKFPCGSLTNSQIWAIYDLNGTCPINFIYMKELKKIITWDNLLKIISKLQLNDSAVTIDFDERVIIYPSWKCPNVLSTTTISSYAWTSYRSRSRSSLYGWNSNRRYILKNGCLLETSYAHQYSYRLCVTDPVNRYSITDNEDNNETYITTN